MSEGRADLHARRPMEHEMNASGDPGELDAARRVMPAIKPHARQAEHIDHAHQGDGQADAGPRQGRRNRGTQGGGEQ